MLTPTAALAAVAVVFGLRRLTPPGRQKAMKGLMQAVAEQNGTQLVVDASDARKQNFASLRGLAATPAKIDGRRLTYSAVSTDATRAVGRFQGPVSSAVGHVDVRCKMLQEHDEWVFCS